MSKLRLAVSKVHLKLAQDVEPAKAGEAAQSSQATRPERRARPKRRAVSVGSHLPANGNGDKESSGEEPQAIRDARARLRALIAAATKDAPRSSIGIVLAIVNQETGNHAAANALIDELALEKRFGIKKFVRDDLTC